MRRTLCIVALATLLGCSQTSPRLEPQPAWVGDCIESSDQRVETALSEVSLASDGAVLIRQLLVNLPDREKLAVAASLAESTRLLGHRPTSKDIERLRDSVAWQAFFLGFNSSPTCDVEAGFVTVEVFTSSVISYLYKRGINLSAIFAELGSPPNDLNTDHEELKIWLLLGAASAL